MRNRFLVCPLQMLASMRNLWHALAHATLVLACYACGHEDANGPSPRFEPEQAAPASAPRDTPLDVVDEALVTTIRVHNTSERVRSRFGSLGEFKIGVRPLGAEVVRTPPTCAPVDCADIPAGETVKPDSECTAPSIALPRHDVGPDSWDEDYTWNGVYGALTQRNCYESMPLKPGDPMVATACYGEPGGAFDVINWTCTDHRFEYGQASFVIELD